MARKKQREDVTAPSQVNVRDDDWCRQRRLATIAAGGGALHSLPRKRARAGPSHLCPFTIESFTILYAGVGLAVRKASLPASPSGGHVRFGSSRAPATQTTHGFPRTVPLSILARRLLTYCVDGAVLHSPVERLRQTTRKPQPQEMTFSFSVFQKTLAMTQIVACSIVLVRTTFRGFSTRGNISRKLVHASRLNTIAYFWG